MKMKVLYAILVAFRFIASLQKGYIHPDEFFQGGQELFFGCPPPRLSPTFQFSQDQDGKRQYPGATTYIPLDSSSYGYKTPIGNIPMDGITATWEFQAENALRSIIPPTIMTILPLKIYSMILSIRLGGQDQDVNDADSYNCYHSESVWAWADCFSGWEILVIPRLFMAFLSILMIDIPIWYIANVSAGTDRGKRSGKGMIVQMRRWKDQNLPVELMLFASSWATIGFLNRPFSNSLETMCLALLCMVVVYDIDMQNNHSFHMKWIGIPFIMGIIGSLGLFTRFTYAIFALPVVLAMMVQRYRALRGGSRWGRTKVVLITIIMVGISFLLTSVAFVYHDSVFYACHGQQEGVGTIDMMSLKDALKNVYLTPWNAFRYNSSVGNLSDHGLHPRITHLLVNFPMLYGPLAIIFIIFPFGIATRKGEVQSEEGRHIHAMLRTVLVFGIAVLSCAPHQEPRFLLPLIVPLFLVAGGNLCTVSKWKTYLIWVWVVFNLLLMAFFCGCHQSAVVPSLLASSAITSKSSQRPSAILYYQTYMPPSFLTRNPATRNMQELLFDPSPNCVVGGASKDADECQVNNELGLAKDSCHHSVPIFDLQGYSTLDFIAFVNDHLSSCSASSNIFFHVVAPRSEMTNLCKQHFKCQNLWSAFQVATEVLIFDSVEHFLESTKLSVYSIRC